MADKEYALVEIMGHRRHCGRITEVERFGVKMLRIDEPGLPTPGQTEETWRTHYYGAASIFCVTPMTEAAMRQYHGDRPGVQYLIEARDRFEDDPDFQEVGE